MMPNPKYATATTAANTAAASASENKTTPFLVAFMGANGADAGSTRAVWPDGRSAGADFVRCAFMASSDAVDRADGGRRPLTRPL